MCYRRVVRPILIKFLFYTGNKFRRAKYTLREVGRTSGRNIRLLRIIDRKLICAALKKLVITI